MPRFRIWPNVSTETSSSSNRFPAPLKARLAEPIAAS
jgi:hypothetical protein